MSRQQQNHGERDYYKVLGLTPQATTKEIQQAYARISTEAKLRLRGAQKPDQAFFEVFDAYQVLVTKKKRENYDNYMKWLQLGGEFEEFNPGEIYANRIRDYNPNEPKVQKRKPPKSNELQFDFDTVGFAPPSSGKVTAPTPKEAGATRILGKSELHEDGAVNPFAGMFDEQKSQRAKSPSQNIAPPSADSGVFFDPNFFDGNGGRVNTEQFSQQSLNESLKESEELEITFEPTWTQVEEPLLTDTQKVQAPVKKPLTPGRPREWVDEDSPSFDDKAYTQSFMADEDSNPNAPIMRGLDTSEGESIGYYLRTDQTLFNRNRKPGIDAPSTPSMRQAPPALDSSTVSRQAPGATGKPKLSEAQLLLKVRDYATEGLKFFHESKYQQTHTVFSKINGYLKLIVQRRDQSNLRKQLSNTGFESIERASQDCMTALRHLATGNFELARRSLRWTERYLQIAAEELGHDSAKAGQTPSTTGAGVPSPAKRPGMMPPPSASMRLQPPAAAESVPSQRVRPPSTPGTMHPDAHLSPDERMAKQAFEKGLLAIKQKDYQGALAHFKWAVELAPKDPMYKSRLAGLLALVNQDLRLAKQLAQEAVDLEPNNANHYYYLGIVYKAAGLKSRAKTCLETALQLEQGHKGASKVLEGLNEA